MISDELANHADRILGWANGQTPTPAALAMLASCLMDLSRQARHLEHLPIDDTELHND